MPQLQQILTQPKVLSSCRVTHLGQGQMAGLIAQKQVFTLFLTYDRVKSVVDLPDKIAREN